MPGRHRVDPSTCPIVVPTAKAVTGLVLETWQRGRLVGHGRKPNMVRVKVDGRKHAETYHVSFWEIESKEV